MIYVYATRRWHGGALLAERLDGRFWLARRPRPPLDPADIVVCWGAGISLPNLTLNRRIPPSKLEELRRLSAAGLPTPQFVTKLPDNPAAWFPRRLHHFKRQDFIDPPTEPDYWTKELDIKQEWRFHIFKGRSLRAALRRHDAAPEFSFRRGPDELRKVALASIKALKLDFGAVDVAWTAEGRPVVFEVNTCPGFSDGGRTVDRYAEAIRKAVLR